MDEFMNYKHEGAMGGNMISLILAVGVSIVIYIFMGVMAGQTYSLSETSITGITNTTIKGHLQSGIGNGFSAYATTGSYIPLVVLAVVLGLVLTAILSSVSGAGAGAGAL